jgi:hypothetical protein
VAPIDRNLKLCNIFVLNALLQQGLLPAITAKRVYRIHGGLSRGPITPEGKERCRAAKIIHGERTQEAIEQFRSKMLKLQNIETLARAIGVITGPKSKGKK